MKKRNKEKFVDDGRVIANMNVDGMPWYSGKPDLETKEMKTAQDFPQSASSQEEVKLTGKEKFAMMRGVVAASLLVTFVFLGGLALFILFCLLVWFK